MTVRCLVIENESTVDVRRLGEWLTDAGLSLEVVRPHVGDAIPTEPAEYAALVVLGGDQHAYPDADGQPGAAWFPQLESLLRRAVKGSVPTLGVCLGGQLLATAQAGLVEESPSGPEIGMALVARRDAAERDPLFGPLPLMPDVMQWHFDEITELPLGATLMAASTRYPVQAFRVGTAAWGVQFHIECDLDMINEWVRIDAELLVSLGLDPDRLLADAATGMDDLFEVWQPFAHRFAMVAQGKLAPAEPAPRPGRELPILGL